MEHVVAIAALALLCAGWIVVQRACGGLVEKRSCGGCHGCDAPAECQRAD